MTTLQLAEAIAHAVLMAACPPGSAPYGDAPAQAVLRTLIEHDAWLYRMTDDVRGVTVETPFEWYQPSLFPR